MKTRKNYIPESPHSNIMAQENHSFSTNSPSIFRTMAIVTAALMMLVTSGIAFADELKTTGDKIKLTDIYKNDSSMRKVEVDGDEYWVPTPSSSERKLKKAAGNSCCQVTLEVTQNDEISHVDIRCIKRRRPAKPKRPRWIK